MRKQTFLKLLFVGLLVSFFIYIAHEKTKITRESEIERLGSKLAYLELHYPTPPSGKWVAAYSENFSKQFALPDDDISKELDKRVHYIEIIIADIPESERDRIENFILRGLRECVINIVMAKDNGISILEQNKYEKKKGNAKLLPLDKPVQFGEYSKDDLSYKRVATFSWADEIIYSHNFIKGYDYFSIKDSSCMGIIKSIKNNEEFAIDKLFKAPQSDFDDQNSLIEVKYSIPYRKIHIKIPPTLIDSLYEGIKVTPPHPRGYELSIFEKMKGIMWVTGIALYASACSIWGCN